MPPSSLNNDIFFIGHSLVAHDIPRFIEGFVEAAGGTGIAEQQIINGAPLRYQWENGANAEGTNAQTALRSGEFEILILTEAVPLRNHLQWSGTTEYATNFVELAASGNPDIQIYIYETWHNLDSGTGVDIPWDDRDHIPWRERLDQDLALWEGIADDINAQATSTGAGPVQLIPAGQALAKLHDEIEAGNVPGMRSIRDFFSDGIHLNDLGKYFVSLVKFATIYDADAADLAALPTDLEAAWWRQVTFPEDTTDALKRIAAEAVAEYQGDMPADPDPENTVPVAGDDTASVAEDGSVSIDVLANDSDPDGDTLSIVSIGDAANGTVTQNGDQLIYTPDAGFSGTDSFTYRISDGNGGTAEARVSVDVQPDVSTPPDTPTPAPKAPLSDDIFYIGSNFVAQDMVKFVNEFVDASGGTGEAVSHFIPGAPIKYLWENDTVVQDGSALDALASGDYEVVVLTEAMPLRTHLQWSGTVEFATNFVDLARSGNPDVQVYIYETWHSLDSGAGADIPWDDHASTPWRDRVDQDLALWEGIVDGVNAQAAETGAVPVRLIPVGQAFAKLYDAIGAGNVPGVSSIHDFLRDDVIPNDMGKYFVALVQFATIYGADAADLAALPTDLEAAWWRQVTFPEDTTDALKRIAAEAVAEYQGDMPADPDPENTVPVAGDDTASVAEDGSVSIDVLANDSDPDGDTLSIVSIGDAANGTVTQNGDQLVYTPDAGFSGADSFTYRISDGNGGSAEARVDVTVSPSAGEPVDTAGIIDLDNRRIESADNTAWRSTQDRGNYALSADGRAITLSDNAWKSIAFNYQITANTMLAFDFTATTEAEIHGIGFGMDGTPFGSDNFFQLYGTQQLSRLYDGDDYDGRGTQRFEIAVGQSYTGDANRIVIIADDDAGIGGSSTYSNIRVWERGLEVNGEALTTESYGTAPGQTPLDLGTGLVSDDGSALSLTAGAWKSVDLDYTVTENTVLRFTFDLDDPDGIHAIGFDTDSIADGMNAFQIAGDMPWADYDLTALYDGGRGGAQTIEIAVGDYFTGDFDKLFFAADGAPDGGTASIFADIELFERSPDPDPAPSPSGVAEGLTNPSLYMNLAFVEDWATSVPFIDVAKMMRPFFSLGENLWEWNLLARHAELVEQGYTDGNGYVTSLPPGARISTLLMTEMPAEAVSVSGRYRLTYEGEGTVLLSGAARNQTVNGNEIWFDYTAGMGPISIDITEIDPNGTGNYIRDISVVREDHIDMFEVGAVFNPTWLEHIEDTRSLRFMDWMGTNASDESEWADRPQVGDAFWTDGNMPVEVMVALANQIGVDPWFNIPHLATDEYIENFATYVRDNLDPNLKAHFEYSNEMWNFSGAFTQTHWAVEQSESYFGADVTWMQFVGMKAAEMAQILDSVYGDEADARLVKVIGGQLNWLGLEEALLNAPAWVAEDPANNRPPHEYFDAYTITGYFGRELAYGRSDDLLSWISESRAAAEAEASVRGLSGEARAEYVEAHKFELAVNRSVEAIREGSLNEVVNVFWPHHREVADRYGLDLIMYEGGTHVDPGPFRWSNPEVVEFMSYLNFSQELADIYPDLMAEWAKFGDGGFNAFTDIEKSGTYGSFGHLRHIDDETPRWHALEEYNATVEAWWGDRGADTFDHGRILIGDDQANRLTGTVEEDILIGAGGDDFFILRGGADRVHGGAGQDTAQLYGVQPAYRFEWDGENLLATGYGTTSTLREIDIIIFADDPGASLQVVDI